MQTWAAAASALFAAIALFVAAWQLSLLRKQAADERQIAVDGVSVAWRAAWAPYQASGDGTAEWTYEITAANPGKLPIDEIEICLYFPCEVQRLHEEAPPDDSTKALIITTPVLLGGGTQSWRRTLRIDFANRVALKETYATIRFIDFEQKARCNTWPRRHTTSPRSAAALSETAR